MVEEGERDTGMVELRHRLMEITQGLEHSQSGWCVGIVERLQGSHRTLAGEGRALGRVGQTRGLNDTHIPRIHLLLAST